MNLKMGTRERERTLENIARLRSVEKENPNGDVAIVREDLEAQLGGTVPRSLSARLLGVSHTALNNWIAAGDVPVVITERGRKEVPIPALLELRDRVVEERKSGRRKLHTLEPIMLEARRRGERMRPRIGLSKPHRPSDPHRLPELRSLAYHQALAPRLRRPMIEEAQRKLERWKREGKIDPPHAEAWEDVLAKPMGEIRKIIAADNARGRDLRQNSPLAGLLSEPERRKILESV
jgi:hypothetical protein